MCNTKAFPIQVFKVVTSQGLARCKSNRMYQAVKLLPALPQLGEQIRNFCIAGDIAGQYDIGTKLGSKLLYTRLQLVVGIAEREFCPFAVHRTGNAVGNRTVARDTDNECFLTG